VPHALKQLQLPDGTLALVLSERVAGPSLPQALPKTAPIALALFVGPEGGWAPEELATLVALGALEVSLGQRILRTETAGLASLAMVMAAYELS
jgi:16S rRNA (uracil1498-N3)-methyltransferase